MSSLIAQGTEFPLRKPAGFHWDIFLLGLTTGIAGILGIPFPNGLIPQAPFHTQSLCVTRLVPVSPAGKDHGDHPAGLRLEAVRVVEQRFSNLAQGLLTGKYLDGVPADSRAAAGKSFDTDWITDDVVRRLRGLNDIAAARDQSLAQLALAWALRDERVTSLVIGASSVAQLEQNVGALERLDFTADELARIDELITASDGSGAVDVDLWRGARNGEVS